MSAAALCLRSVKISDASFIYLSTAADAANYSLLPEHVYIHVPVMSVQSHLYVLREMDINPPRLKAPDKPMDRRRPRRRKPQKRT